MGALAAVGCLQAYLMWNFITSKLASIREASSLSVRRKADKKAPPKVKKEKKRLTDEEVNDLPEVDQNTAKKNNLRARTQKAK